MGHAPELGYDAFSNVISEAQTIDEDLKDPVTKTFVKSYDQAGNRIGTDCPSGGGSEVACIEQGYDGLNRVVSMDRDQTRLVNYAYANGGNGLYLDHREILSTTSGVSVKRTVDYNNQREIGAITNEKSVSGQPSTIARYELKYYDGLGKPDTMEVSGLSNYTESVGYHYDDLQRLDKATYDGDPGATETFTMDSLGNRTTYANTHGTNLSFTYGTNNKANEYADINGWDLYYLKDGNLSNNENYILFDYDYEDHLCKIWQGYDAEFGYDALGRRVYGSQDGEVTYYFYDDQRVFAETDDTGGLKRYYVDGAGYIDEHVAEVEQDGQNQQDFYYLLGPLYSVVGLVDPNGDLVEATRYDAYGVPHTTQRPGNPVVSEAGSRYIDVVPADGEDPIALMVTGQNPQALTCVQLYIQDDDPATSYNEFGSVGPDPVFRTPAEWVGGSGDGVIHVRWEEIRPSVCDPASACTTIGSAVIILSQYVVQAVTSGAAGALFSDPSTIGETWRWGNTDDDDVVDLTDVNRVVSAFQGQYAGQNPPLTPLMADFVGAYAAPYTYCEPPGTENDRVR